MKSLKSKMILIYFLLVFIAMIIVGVFLTTEFEKYNMKIIRRNMININENVIKNMNISNKDTSEKDLQKTIDNIPISKTYEISIIDPKDFSILASTNSTFESKNAFLILDENTLLKVITEKIVEKNIQVQGKNYSIKNMAFLNEDNLNNYKYILYIRCNLEEIDSMIDKVARIIIKATILALFITIFFGYFMANSITIPIKKLTENALVLSKGDFSKRIEITSDDEIGRLGSTFNYLSKNLEAMINELSSEKNKLNAIIYHIQNGLVAIDNFGKIMHYNVNFEYMIFGKLTNENLIGKKYDDIISKCSKELSFSKIIENYSSSNVDNINIKIKDRAYKVGTSAFKEKDGGLGGVILIFIDTTKEERLENLRKEFVSNVSHELKTPITSIKSYVETLLDGAILDKDIAYDFLNVILSESNRMNKIIKDLLQLSHMDYKKEKWDMKNESINLIVKEAFDRMKLYSEKKKQMLILQLPNEDIISRVDKFKMIQVVTNLISNAIKYTKENGKIEVKLFEKSGFFYIQIKDNGIGIPKEDIQYIFDRFYRVDKGRSRDLGGTGLGLSICENIVKEHNGEIIVESEFKKGSCFTVKIPFTKNKLI